jgi:hypothetical protein
MIRDVVAINIVLFDKYGLATEAIEVAFKVIYLNRRPCIG